MKKDRKIVAMTTDPYDNIYGYALVFVRLFTFIKKRYQNLDVSLISNDGACSRMVDSNESIKIRLNPKSSLFLKTILLVCSFIKKGWACDKDTILVVNSEIPELFSALILKMKFKSVYCIIHDIQLRDRSFKTRLIHKFRLFFVRRIGKVIFVNKHTMCQFDDSISKYYIGNPIF